MFLRHSVYYAFRELINRISTLIQRLLYKLHTFSKQFTYQIGIMHTDTPSRVKSTLYKLH